MTKGCLWTEKSGGGAGEGTKAVGGVVVEERDVDERSPSRRRPEKCGPDAASMT